MTAFIHVLTSALEVSTETSSGYVATARSWVASLSASPRRWPRCAGSTIVMPTWPCAGSLSSTRTSDTPATAPSGAIAIAVSTCRPMATWRCSAARIRSGVHSEASRSSSPSGTSDISIPSSRPKDVQVLVGQTVSKVMIR